MNDERWRTLLREERQRVEDALERCRRESAATSEGLAQVAQLEERLAAVAQAEERLKEGRHGTRVESGGLVPEAHLDASPEG